MLVRDVFSGREMDLQGLMRVAEASERVPDEKFDMTFWWSVSPLGADCGTAGCLIGNFCAANPADRLVIVGDKNGFSPELPGMETIFPFETVASRFGISIDESEWLFGPDGVDREDVMRNNDREHCVRRVRKFIYYKLRKAELLADYQQARRTGDVGLMQAAEREANQLCLA